MKKETIKTTPFELVSKDKENIIIKVNLENTLDAARFPYVDMSYEYITISTTYDGPSCPPTYIMTIVKKDKSWSFYWGYGGCTCISRETRFLKDKVLEFLKDHYIVLW